MKRITSHVVVIDDHDDDVIVYHVTHARNKRHAIDCACDVHSRTRDFFDVLHVIECNNARVYVATRRMSSRVTHDRRVRRTNTIDARTIA